MGKKIIYLILIAAVVIWNVTIFAKSASDRDERMWDEYYLNCENDYRAEVRGYLFEEGFENAGIMLTHTTSGDGERVYTLKVHHSAFENIGKEATSEVVNELKNMGFADERCSFEVCIF